MFFTFFYKPYIAIIGDIKSSKKLSDRKAVQDKLQRVLMKVNEKYDRDIASKFTITLGDEFQGLLCNGKNIIKIIFEIENCMWPIDIRFGIGIGEITTGIEREISIGADGPGYYRAREAIENLRKNEKKKQTDTANIHLVSDIENQEAVLIINTVFTLLCTIKESWSDRQREVILDMLEHGDTQTAVAERLKVRQPTIQKILASGKYYAYKEAIDVLEKILGEINWNDI